MLSPTTGRVVSMTGLAFSESTAGSFPLEWCDGSVTCNPRSPGGRRVRMRSGVGSLRGEGVQDPGERGPVGRVEAGEEVPGVGRPRGGDLPLHPAAGGGRREGGRPPGGGGGGGGGHAR